MRRTPPDILITTPESLYLMLTSQAREIFARRRVGDRRRDPRGRRDQARRAPRAHARAPRRAQADRDPQRIGLQRDAEPARGGRALPGRPAAHVRGSSTPACASRSTSRSTCRSSRWSSPSRRRGDPTSTPLAGGEATRKSIWPAIYPELLELVREHRSTIVFVNNRRGAERLALRLNELAEEDDRARPPRLARARGAPRRRGAAQGRRAAVPGRDLVARARHRHGRRRPRAAGRVAEVGRARAAAHRPRRPRRRRHAQGPHLPQVPRRPARVRGRRQAHARGPDRADRRAAQRARRARPADRRHRGAAPSTSAVDVDELLRARHAHALLRRAVARRCSRTCSTCSTAATRRRSSASCARASCGTASAGTIRARKGARALAVTNAGTIPDRGLFSVVLPDGRRVGELDEEMVYEARAGPDVPARRVDVADRGDRPRPRDRHARARRARARCRSGRATASGARRSSARRSAPSRAGRSTSPPRCSSATTTSTRSPRATSLDYLREQQDATRVVPERPHDRRRALPRRDRRLAPVRALARTAGACTPPGGWRCRARIRDELRPRVRRDLVRRRDHRPPPRRRRAAGRRPRADRPRRARGRASSPSSARARCSARASARTPRRALLIPRAYPGKRTPLWQQRLKSQSLLEVAKRYARLPDHPRDLPRVPARRARPARACSELLRALHRRELVAGRGRDADRLAVRLVAAVRLRRHLHVRGRHAQRRAPRGGAVARPRPAARAARPGGAARAHRPRRARRRSRPTSSTAPSARAPTTRDALADVLRRVGDLTADEVARPRARRRRRRRRCSTELEARAPRRARCASAARSAGSPPTTPACTATRSAPCRPAGCPRPSSPTSTAPLREARRPLRAHARPVHDRRAARPLRRRPDAARWRRSSAPASSSAASCAPAAASASGATPRSCAACAAPRSPCCARRSRPPTSARWPRFLPSWQGVDRHPAGGAGVDRLREVLVPLQGLALPADVWERDVLPRRVRRLLADVAGPAVRVAARSSGSAPGALGRSSGRVALYFRDDAEAIGPAAVKQRPSAPDEPEHDAAARAPGAARRASSPTCSPSCRSRPSSSRRRCGTSSGRAR